jgi:hypothetical protein
MRRLRAKRHDDADMSTQQEERAASFIRRRSLCFPEMQSAAMSRGESLPLRPLRRNQFLIAGLIEPSRDHQPERTADVLRHRGSFGVPVRRFSTSSKFRKTAESERSRSIEIADYLLRYTFEYGCTVRVLGTSLGRGRCGCVGYVARAHDEEGISYPSGNYFPRVSLSIRALALHCLISERSEFGTFRGAYVLVELADTDAQHLWACAGSRQKLAKSPPVFFRLKMK